MGSITWNEDMSLNQDTVCGPNNIEDKTTAKMCMDTFFNQNTFSCAKGVQNRKVPVYTHCIGDTFGEASMATPDW